MVQTPYKWASCCELTLNVGTIRNIPKMALIQTSKYFDLPCYEGIVYTGFK